MEMLDNFVEVEASRVFIPEGRFRPLNKATVKTIKESISVLGQLQPIQVDKNLNLIDGNHRLNACLELGIKVRAEVIDIYDSDILDLREIDSNLMRKELSPRELEEHLVKRKEIYLKLYPDTAQGKNKDNAKTFTEDTAEKTGKSKRTIERLVKRGEEASEELKDARDEGKVSSTDIDKILSEVGTDAEKQKQALVEIMKNKSKKTETVKEKEDIIVEEPSANTEEVEKLKKELEEKTKALEELEIYVQKIEAQNERLKNRIAKAKTSNPDIKI